MCLTEYNEAEAMEMLRQEAIQEGMQQGMQQGMQKGMQQGIQKGKYETWLFDIKNLIDGTGWTAEKAMDTLKIPLNQRDAIYADLSENS